MPMGKRLNFTIAIIFIMVGILGFFYMIDIMFDSNWKEDYPYSTGYEFLFGAFGFAVFIFAGSWALLNQIKLWKIL